MFAERFLPQNKSRRRKSAAALALSLSLLCLPRLFRLDGQPRAEWQQFLGRFHPLAVHVPIALILLVPLLELGGAVRSHLRETVSFVLGIAFVSCIGSLVLGYLLAYGSGDSGPTVLRHMWGGILLTICTLMCLLARPGWTSSAVDKVYPALLILTMIVMMWTAHQGGSLTHGSKYLTEYMPKPLKKIVSLGTSQIASSSFYAQNINPIWDKNCLSCHGGDKVKGNLRMDTFEALMEGGKDGPVIVPGRPQESLLLKRVTLPEGHKQFMPAERKPPLSKEQIAWITAWIQQGASPTVTYLEGVSVREAVKETSFEPVGDYSKLQPEIDRMKILPGVKLIPVSAKPSDGLVLNTVDMAGGFDDAQLSQFEKFAPYIVEANLARTAVTDASFTILAKFIHLRSLHLEDTGIVGNGIEKLAGLKQLTYLNLSETKMTSAAAGQLTSIKSIQHIYLFNTPARPLVSAEPMRKPS